MSVGKLSRLSLPFSNVTQAGTATANITPGRTIEGLRLSIGGNIQSATAWDITSATHTPLIRVKANGKTILEGTGAQLAAIAKFKGHPTSTTELYLDFTESFKGRDFLDEMVGAWDTSLGVANITVEVQIGGSGGSFTGTLALYTVESAPQSVQGLPFAGMMAKILRYPYSVAAGGDMSIPLPFGKVNGAIIKRIHIMEGTAGRVTKVTLKQDGVVIADLPDAQNDAQNAFFRNTNQTGVFSVDLIPDGNIKNALDSRDANSLELIPTFGAADNGYVLVEYLDKLGNL